MSSDHDKYAHDYDRQIQAYDCYLAEVLFGLCYEEIDAGQRLLDIGIGTGLSSKLFKRAGLHILGIDGSRAMLGICAQKNIADELTEKDLLDMPWPYRESSIEHVISCGVFHFSGDLETIFTEVRRIQAQDGIFAFTVMQGAGTEEDQQKYTQRMEDGLAIFTHNSEYIDGLLRRHHYQKLKDITCLVGDTAFRAVCSRKR